jgi:putative SOS response-associated peptidase YedK
MCTLYADVASQEAHRRIFGIDNDRAGNLDAMPAIYPDGIAPVIGRDQNGKRGMVKMRWGFPPPPAFGSRPVVNVRNTKSGFWKKYLEPEYRCLVPATSFCEWTDSLPKTTKWFALSEKRPLFAFAGIWRKWEGVRGTKKDPVEGEHLLYSFLTTNPNADVKPIHSKAMPVILREDDWETWLTAPAAIALKLQKPLSNGALIIVASGERKD